MRIAETVFALALLVLILAACEESNIEHFEGDAEETFQSGQAIWR